MPLLRLAPGGRPTSGTLDVEETKVGSEILVLSIVFLCRLALPGALCGTVWFPAALIVMAGAGDGSGEISYKGGVALAEYGGAMGDGLGETPITGELAACAGWSGLS